MFSPVRVRSLQGQAILWVVLPLFLTITSMVVVGILAYQRVVTALILERHQQLANLAAVSVSQVIDGYADVLATLASKPRLQSESAEIREQALEETIGSLEVFNAGVAIVDGQGNVLTRSSPHLAFLGSNVAPLETFQSVRDDRAPSFSNVLTNEESEEDFILIAVPLFNQAERFDGAIIGALDLERASLSEPIRRLTVGFAGYAYLVDRRGDVIAHSDPVEIGRNYGDRPFVENVINGRQGGAVWASETGEYLVGSNALVSISGWGLIVEEPWSSIMSPMRAFGSLVIMIGLAITLGIVVLAWRGVRQITIPIQHLSRQIGQLAAGKSIEPVHRSQILEIDALEKTFADMAEQIEDYRKGLRRYLGAITKSQEDERRRISRELHDETVQSLLTIRRRLELFEATERDTSRLAQILELQEIVDDTLNGIRQISKDLRPLILEDLGLLPALQMLARSMHNGPQAIPHVRLEVSGDKGYIPPDRELSIYRIVQEALTNVRKHARATKVLIEIGFEPGMVSLAIQDDGAGFEAPEPLAELAKQDRYGLIGIEERVWAAGGALSIQSAPGRGTRLCVNLPVEPETS